MYGQNAGGQNTSQNCKEGQSFHCHLVQAVVIAVSVAVRNIKDIEPSVSDF